MDKMLLAAFLLRFKWLYDPKRAEFPIKIVVFVGFIPHFGTCFAVIGYRTLKLLTNEHN